MSAEDPARGAPSFGNGKGDVDGSGQAESLSELIVKHQAGELTPAEELAFAAALDDPANRRRFLDHTLLSVALIRAPAATATAAAAAAIPIASLIPSHAPRWPWWTAGAAIAASLAVAVGAMVLAKPSVPLAPAIAVISDAAPGALVHRGGDDIPASPGMEVRDGDALASSGGVLAVRWNHEDTTIELGADSLATLREGGSGKRIELGSGAVTAEVAKQPPGKPLKVVASEAEATVIGTRFTFSREPAGARLAVEHGLVGLLRLADGATVEVPAGRSAIAGSVASPAVHGAGKSASAPIAWAGWRRFGMLPVWQLPTRAEIDADDTAAHDAMLATSEAIDLARGAELSFSFTGPVTAQSWRIDVLALDSLEPGAREAVAWEVEARDPARVDLAAGTHRVRFLFAEHEWRALVDDEPVARFRYADGISAGGSTGGRLHLGLRATSRDRAVPLSIDALVVTSPVAMPAEVHDSAP